MFVSPDLPLERILISGGDTRLDIDPRTGRNRYECWPRPGDAIPFGSCTSSSVSHLGYAAAQNAHRLILGSADSLVAIEGCAEAIRRRLRALLTLPAGVDVALAPSGTDAELLALALAAGDRDRTVMNIVVGPSEVGSGTPLAAACRHYDRLTPGGRSVAASEPIDPRLAALVDVRTVDLRAANGAMLSESEIDAAVVELLAEASEKDAAVLLHIVAHSKTGVHAPSLACVARLQRASEDVLVVIDAAQGRFSRRGLRSALEKGYLVMLTGSKFYGGPPFSGALLVPPNFHPACRRLSRFPNGFCAYFSAAEMPSGWREIRRSLAVRPNLGAILRWSAALAEMDDYYAVPSEARLAVLRYFESVAPQVLGGSDCIRLLPIFMPVYDDASERLLESKTTVFGFWVTPPGAHRPLGQSELKHLHGELTTDVSSLCGSKDRGIASQKFHVGQPVDLGQAGSVLRVALGGSLITRVSTDHQIGESFEERLIWLRDRLAGLRQKIECLAALRAPRFAEVSAGKFTGLPVLEQNRSPSESPVLLSNS